MIFGIFIYLCALCNYRIIFQFLESSMNPCQHFLISNLSRILTSVISNFPPEFSHTTQIPELLKLKQTLENSKEQSDSILLDFFSKNSQIREKIEERVREILLWSYSFFRTFEEKVVEEKKEEFLSTILEINKNYKKGEFKTYFLMSLLTIRKKWGWSIDQCKQL